MCARQIQTKHQSVYAGSRLKPTMCEKVLPYMPAFQPYRGKPAVRNDRGDRGNVGIIRSPLRASILPDQADPDHSILLYCTHRFGSPTIW
jgi:hypothetical protein